jgi:hypothetical protein
VAVDTVNSLTTYVVTTTRVDRRTTASPTGADDNATTAIPTLGPTHSKDWPSLSDTGQPSTITQGPATFMFTGARFAPDHTVYCFPIFNYPAPPFPRCHNPNHTTTLPKKNKPLLPKRHSPRRVQPHPRRQRVVHARRGLGRRLLDVPLRLDQRRPLWLCAGYDHRGGGFVGARGWGVDG